jgi:hypothetical protein
MPRKTTKERARRAKDSKHARSNAVLMVRLPRKRTRTKRVGRPKGAPDTVPRRARASVKAVIEEVVSERAHSIYDAVLDGITSGPRYAHNYLRLAAEYTDGKPDATLNLRTQFREDEVATATKALGRKMQQLFERAASTVAILPPAETSIKSAVNQQEDADA